MIPESIKSKIGAGLLNKPNHPISLVKNKITSYFAETAGIGCPVIEFHDPHVSVKANFDDLLIPKDHPSRSDSDTFYKDKDTVLRTHTSAHQTELIRDGHYNFLAFGDCYRKDTVDATHYPVFHQVEGVRLQGQDYPWDSLEKVETHLKQTLEGLVKYIFGTQIQIKWSTDYFPFTDPSWEMEIRLNGEWLEILGCGIVQPKILTNCGVKNYTGWAFGIGLERLAMILYQIPDIRLFWTDDERFHSQFKHGDAIFVPYSKHPPVYKDISFWLGEGYHENQLHGLAREIGRDLIEEVKLTDDFTHPKTGRTNNTFRITYRHPGRTLTNEEINLIQNSLRNAVEQRLNVELR